MADRLRLLLIAEACNPTWTSVPLVGYNFARALTERGDLDITLVTHIKNQDALRDDPISRKARIHIIDNEWLARPMYRLATVLRGGEKLGWTVNTALAWPSYVAFERQVERDFRGQLNSGQFDLIHRLTPLSPTLPSPLAAWTRVPMMIGPLNGGLPWPKEYPSLARQEREWLAGWRSAYRILPYYRPTYQHMRAVIAGSRHTATEIPTWFRGQRFYLPENGIDPERFPIAAGWSPPERRFRFIFVGRIVPYKGLMIVLEALASSPRLKQCELIVVGDGPQRQEAERYIAGHGLASAVRLVGWLEQKQVAGMMHDSQAFVFPSVREFGGGVVLEAMACGLPAIIVNYGGPSELVDQECGIPLPMAGREAMIDQVRTAMERLVVDPDLCHRLGRAAVQKVQEQFTWNRKADRLVEFYRATLVSGAAAK
jgi:glycosyltransferase involved in cell wall biosynthesis